MTHSDRLAASHRRRAYKCIFFDLDHTLWDYDCNARETLGELHSSFHLDERGVPFEPFFESFRRINVELWALYDQGLVNNDVIRHQRFRRVLEGFGVTDDKLSDTLADEYFWSCPRKANLMPYAREVLEYLAAHYAMTVVTNGFEEIQSVKLTSGNITHYFDHIITSQKAGHKKPAREIFEYALSVNGLRHHEVVMIGDNLVADIGGARNARIDAVYFNPAGLPHSEEVSHEIRCLSELRQIL